MKENEFAEDTYATWLFGILILTIALTLSSVLGFIQDMGIPSFNPGVAEYEIRYFVGFNKWGKQTDEAMFMTHLFSLPMFISFGSELTSHLSIWYLDSHLLALQCDLSLFFQVIERTCVWSSAVDVALCARECGVAVRLHPRRLHIDGCRWSSLRQSHSNCPQVLLPHVQVLLLIGLDYHQLVSSHMMTSFSVYVFNNPFSMWHWAGAMLVFMGCLAYSQAPSPTPTPKTKV